MNAGSFRRRAPNTALLERETLAAILGAGLSFEGQRLGRTVAEGICGKLRVLPVLVSLSFLVFEKNINNNVKKKYCEEIKAMLSAGHTLLEAVVTNVELRARWIPVVVPRKIKPPRDSDTAIVGSYDTCPPPLTPVLQPMDTVQDGWPPFPDTTGNQHREKKQPEESTSTI